MRAQFLFEVLCVVIIFPRLGTLFGLSAVVLKQKQCQILVWLHTGIENERKESHTHESASRMLPLKANVT